MPYTIERLPENPIIYINQVGSGFVQDMREFLPQLNTLLNDQEEPVYLVFDMRTVSLSVDELTEAAYLAAGQSGSMTRHPRVIESLLVTTNAAIRLAAQGMRTATFGNAEVRTFDTPEQALDYCREQIAQTAGTVPGDVS